MVGAELTDVVAVLGDVVGAMIRAAAGTVVGTIVEAVAGAVGALDGATV